MFIGLYLMTVSYIPSAVGGWVGASAMTALTALDCSVSRGAISRGRVAVHAWSLERHSSQVNFSTVKVAIFGFCLGWICCFAWLLFPTVVHAN